MKTFRGDTWRPFQRSGLTSVKSAMSLEPTPSIFLEMQSQETCLGPVWCSDLQSRRPGTGALIRLAGEKNFFFQDFETFSGSQSEGRGLQYSKLILFMGKLDT